MPEWRLKRRNTVSYEQVDRLIRPGVVHFTSGQLHTVRLLADRPQPRVATANRGYPCRVRPFERLSESERERVVAFGSRLDLPPESWYNGAAGVLGGPGKKLELSDYFWTELFNQVATMHNIEKWQSSLRSALYGDANGMVDYREWVRALQDASSVAGIAFADVLDAYFE